MTQEIIDKYGAAKDEYLSRLGMNGLSQTTQKNYESTLRRFGDFLRETDADDLCEAAEDWKETLLGNGSAPGTVNQYLTNLGIFFKKSSKRSFPKELRFDENPVEDVEPIKFSAHPYAEILTDNQIIKLFSNRPYHGAKHWEKNYAIVMVLLNEKLRNSELTALTPADVDFIHHEITVRNGKGGKYRVVDLSDLSETAITAYLESEQRPANLEDTDYLFGSNYAGKWHRMSKQALSEIVEHHIKKVCGVSGVRSHALRHVGSRICLNAGQSLEELQGQLGHSSKRTTEIYSGRVLQRRRRESAQKVLDAREIAADRNRKKREAEKRQIKIVKMA